MFLKVAQLTKKYIRHLNKNQLIDARETCPICQYPTKRPIAAKIQDNSLIEFLYCPKCKGYSASKMPTTEILKSYYNNYYEWSDKQYIFDNFTRFAKHIYKYIPIQKDTKQLKILDFGGGDGSLGKEIAKLILNKNNDLQITVFLVDYHKQDDLINQYIKFFSKQSLDEINKKFDIVLASAILEHIPDLHYTLNKLFSRVKKNGFFYARTPCTMPLKKIIKKTPMFYPMHVHDLGPSFWNRIIKNFDIDAKILTSKPAIVATEFKREFELTLLAYLLKFPAYLEKTIRFNPKDYIWDFAGGWEVFIQFK